MDRHLSPTEVSRRFGISIKALRLYEQRGLLTPQRTRNGSSGAAWRAYAPDQIARLHQILALKRLGLPLVRIGQLLAGPDALETVLALQEQALVRDRETLSRALALVRAARAKLAAGTALSIDDLANLTKETVMTRPDAKEMGQLLKPFSDRYFSAEEKEAMKNKAVDRDKLRETAEGLIAESQALMEIGDPTSPAAQDVARRFMEFNEQVKRQVTGDIPDVRTKGRALWNDAMEDPATAGKLAPMRDIFAFVNRAIEYRKSLAK